MMELAGAEGILVSGGALTGKHVDFYDLKTKRYVILTVVFIFPQAINNKNVLL